MTKTRIALMTIVVASAGCSVDDALPSGSELEASASCSVYNTSGSSVVLPAPTVNRIRGLPHWTPGEADLPNGDTFAASVHLSVQVNGDRELSFVAIDDAQSRSISGHVSVTNELEVGSHQELTASFAPTGPNYAAAQLNSFSGDGTHFIVPIEEVSLEVEPTGFYSLVVQLASLERFPPSTAAWTNDQLEIASTFDNENIVFVGRLTAACVDSNPTTGEVARVMDVSSEEECASFMQHL